MSDERLDHAREAAIVDEILAVLRHDVRNKLAAARQAAQYLRRRAEGSELMKTDARFEKFFQLIDDQLSDADAQLTSHPILARPHLRAPAALDPERVARRGIATAGIADDVDLEFAPGAPFGDEAEIVVALSLLLDNAARHTPDGTKVSLCGQAEGSMYVFFVSDDGPGVSQDTFRMALRLESSKTNERRGLGLPIVRRIALRNEGTFKLIPVARGTRIALGLPTARDESVRP